MSFYISVIKKCINVNINSVLK